MFSGFFVTEIISDSYYIFWYFRQVYRFIFRYFFQSILDRDVHFLRLIFQACPRP